MRGLTLFTLLSVLALAAPASACINDREIDNAEREFKSSYPDAVVPEVPPESVQPPGYDRFVVGGLGALLLAGAMVVATRRPARSD